jgi:hypothetical protein
MNDPIVDEIRRCRMEHTRKFGGSLNVICEDLRRIQRESDCQVVHRSPKLLSPTKGNLKAGRKPHRTRSFAVWRPTNVAEVARHSHISTVPHSRLISFRAFQYNLVLVPTFHFNPVGSETSEGERNVMGDFCGNQWDTTPGIGIWMPPTSITFARFKVVSSTRKQTTTWIG